MPQYSDYDNVPHPTASKVHVEVGSGKGPAVEAETPSDAQTVVEPAKNAFLPDKDEPPPAPKSSAGDASMFQQAEAAHSSAEKKEDAEHTQVEQVKETEPTNVVGAELPVALVADQVEKKVEEENNREAPVPLEEAAPTPSSDTSSPTASEPIASKADPVEKAGAQIVRNAEADLAAKGVAAGAGDHRAAGAQDLHPKAAEAQQVLGDLEEVAVAVGDALQQKAEPDADADLEPIPAKQEDFAEMPRPPADADELAAAEERERFNKDKEA